MLSTQSLVMGMTLGRQAIILHVKGALKIIMQRQYANWEACRYVQPGSYDEHHMWISEKELKE